MSLADSASEQASSPSYVMKMRCKDTFQNEAEVSEYRLLQTRLLSFPAHRGVMPIHEVFEDDQFFYVIMEKAQHGALFDGLLMRFEDGVIPEEQVRKLVREILEALCHAHSHGMLHRDIKPDNLALRSISNAKKDNLTPKSIKGYDPSSSCVCLIDFDHAYLLYRPGQIVETNESCGTFRYNAPETFRGRWSVQSELYSVGCILYLLMTGMLPHNDEVFDGAEADIWEGSNRQIWRQSVYQRMRDERINLDASPFGELSTCRDFCKWLLEFDPARRPISAEAALAHAWLK
jgi:serine/threonine protein kinase